MRPDLAKLGYFLKSLAILSDGFLVLAQIWSPFCQLNSIEQNFNVVNGQIVEKQSSHLVTLSPMIGY